MPPPTTLIPYVPRAVAKTAQTLQQATGTTPALHRPATARIVLELTRDRVELTITWRRNTRGRWKQQHTKLTVDGTDHDPGPDYAGFLRLWNNPDAANTPPEPVELPELHPVNDPTAPLPPLIQVMLRQFHRALRDTPEASVLLGQTERGYTLQVTSPRATLRANFTQRGHTPYGWNTDPRKPFEIFDEHGTERTAEFTGDLQAALSAVLGNGSSTPGAPGRTGNPRPAAVSNSVQARRHSVIRV